MIFSFTGATFADSHQLSKESYDNLQDTFKTVQDGNYTHKYAIDLVDENGVTDSVLTTEVERTVKKDDSNGVIKVVLDQVKTREYKDGTVEKENVVDEIEITKQGEFFINGEKLSNEELNQTFEQPKNSLQAGGKTWLTYYKIFQSNGKTTYNYRSYEKPGNNFLDYGGGKHFTFNTLSKNTNFQSLARDVGQARDNITAASAALLSALGLSALTWNAVIVALTGAAGVANLAWQVFTNSSDAKGWMKEAYNIYM